MLICAIAYSNLQRGYLSPANISGILVDEVNLPKIAHIRTKEDFQPAESHLQDPFDLTEIENELSKYLPLITKKAIIQITTDQFDLNPIKPSELEQAFKNIINKLVYEDISIGPNNVREIRLHESHDESPLMINTSSILDFFSDARIPRINEKKPHFSEIMQLARLLVWKEYLVSRRRDRRITNTYLKNNPDKKFLHFINIKWPYVRIEAFANSCVGYPEMIVRTGRDVNNISLHTGMNVSFFPFAKTCVGNFNADVDSNLCLSSKKSVYGAVLSVNSNDIRCKKCGIPADKLKFNRKGIDNLTVDDQDPLEMYNEEPHFIYITRFAGNLKIGRSRLSRGITRLLEQSVSDSLIIYPILSYEQADKIESEIVNHLKKYVQNLQKFGIHSISDKARFDDKILMIKQWINEGTISNNDLYQEILKLIKENEALANILDVTDNRVINLTANWQFDKNTDLADMKKIDTYWNNITGKLNGIIGSLIFVGTSIINMEEFQGCLFKGSGFY